MNEPNDDAFYEMAGHHHVHHPFLEAMLGGLVGYIASRTRFGQWFEHSPVVGFIIFLILLAVGGYLGYCIVTYFWFLAQIMLVG